MGSKFREQTDADYQNSGVKSPPNICVQTGEEFLDEFLRDRVASRRVPVANDAYQIPSSKPGYDVAQDHLVTSNHDTRKTDAESYPDYVDLSSGEGNGVYMNGSNAYYKELHVNGQNHRKCSGDLDRGSPSGPLVYSSEFPHSNQSYSKASQCTDSSFSGKLKLLCSFGGKILPRPNDGKLRYVGGDTRIISLEKNATYLELLKKTMVICKYHNTIKYQLPGEDLDALISVASDEDLHHMFEEYHDQEKVSQRPRLFLVSSCDIESPYSSEGRTMQQGDCPYVAAVNGMVDSSPRRTYSRESLESQWTNNVDSPTLQMDSPTSFHHLEYQNGGGSLNTTWTLSNLSSQVFSTPQVPSTTCVASSPFPPVQFTYPSASYLKGYEDAHSSYGYTNKFPYVMESTANNNPHCFDAAVYYHNQLVDTSAISDSSDQNSQMAYAHATTPLAVSHFHMPSKDFQPTSPYAPRFADAMIGFANVPPQSEKLVPSQEKCGYYPVTDVGNSYWTNTNPIPESQPTNEVGSKVPLEQDTENISWAFGAEKLPSLEMSVSSLQEVEEQKAREKDQVTKSEYQVFHETINLNKDSIEWGGDTIMPIKNNSVGRYRETFAIEKNYVLNDEFLEHTKNLPQIICRPDSQVSFHVPKSELQMSGIQNSSSSFSSAEYPADFWKELSGNCQISQNKPEFLIKSQTGPHPTDCDTDFYDHLIFPETTADHSLKGDVTCQKEMVKKSNDMTSSHECAKNKITYINSMEDLDSRNGTFVNSQYPNNYHKPGIQQGPVKVEDVAGSLQHGIPSSSTNSIQGPEEDSEAAESPEDTSGTESHLSESNDYDVGVGEITTSESLSEAAVIEKEASIYGLQIIRNTELDDLQELGSGTFGTVFHGKWRGTDVAIKRIKQSCFAGRSSEQEKLAKDFWREAKILSTLHHPNIVAFYGVVPDGPGGTLATVTEYLVNGSLRHVLLRKGRVLDRRRKVIIALDAAFGMEYLHVRNIVHFDLKCDNLLVNLGDPRRPVCKVGDFGLSRIKRNTFVSGGVRGTLPWMAPELLNGNSSQVDVFSFGVTLWEILTGEEPYVNMHCGAIIGGIVSDSLRPPVPERCDPEWRKLMEQCWSHEPEERPPFSEITKRLQGMSKAILPKRVSRVQR
ncbi:uncharacterized protein LOC121808276 isoform X2 [Salvia splendens]|uniref:uncharacterized protein LOC121808276 isoform X2 n=1 Tax=Salvia splendens TaxID=180675 RepID=UPI0011003AE7|nr:uncharacterized protein LOC121808276 isoform X2 [Salvia splendens]